MAGAWILAFNKFFGIENLASPFGVAGADKACMQNIFEFVSATSASMTGIKPDNASAGATNILFCNNSLAGLNDHGRSNHVYDEGATPRASKFIRQHGTSLSSSIARATRSCWTAPASEISLTNMASAARIILPSSSQPTATRSAKGRFRARLCGVGRDLRHIQYCPQRPALHCAGGHQQRLDRRDRRGTYTLQTGSPCKASVTAMLSHDLAGNMRSLGALAEQQGSIYLGAVSRRNKFTKLP